MVATIFALRINCMMFYYTIQKLGVNVVEQTREEAWRLLRRYTDSENLIKHALAVEAAMRAYARKFGEDEEKWGIVGLLHDFDYDRYPDEHPLKGAEILADAGYPDEIIHAIQTHVDSLELPRESKLEKTLYAVDELCGFITAVTLVRPGHRVADVPLKSVRKKLKDKAFARNVSRTDIQSGADELGVDLDRHIEFVVSAMAGVAEELGLDGN